MWAPCGPNVGIFFCFHTWDQHGSITGQIIIMNNQNKFIILIILYSKQFINYLQYFLTFNEVFLCVINKRKSKCGHHVGPTWAYFYVFSYVGPTWVQYYEFLLVFLICYNKTFINKYLILKTYFGSYRIILKYSKYSIFQIWVQYGPNVGIITA